MRKHILLMLVLVTTLTGLVAGRAAAAVSTPTCLLINGGSSQMLTKTMVCAELATNGTDRVGVGRYAPPDHAATHWMTLSVEYLPQGSTSGWITLGSVTRSGTGTLMASTPPVVVPGGGKVQACTRAGLDVTKPNARMCVPGN